LIHSALRDLLPFSDLDDKSFFGQMETMENGLWERTAPVALRTALEITNLSDNRTLEMIKRQKRRCCH
jgi:hypothetical protein